MIIRPAFLEICPLCSQHAHITLPDRGDSAEFTFKDEAIITLSDGYKQSMFTIYEFGELLENIKACCLPKTSCEVEPLLLWRVDQFNRIRDAKQHYGISICKYLHNENFTEPVPEDFLLEIGSEHGTIITNNQYCM
jgi:hypothetical protein